MSMKITAKGRVVELEEGSKFQDLVSGYGGVSNRFGTLWKAYL